MKDGRHKLYVFYVMIFLVAGFYNGTLKSPFSGIDFYGYWLAPSTAINEKLNFYSPEHDGRFNTLFREHFKDTLPPDVENTILNRMTSSPLLYTVISLLFPGSDYDWNLKTFRWLSLLISAISILALFKLIGISGYLAMSLYSYFLLFFFPLQADWIAGNVGQFQLALMTLSLVLFTRGSAATWVLSGAVLSFSILFKANFFLLALCVALLTLFERDWRKFGLGVLGVTLGVIFGLGLTVWRLGSFDPWVTWVSQVFPHLLARTDLTIANGNYALMHMIFDTTGWDLTSLATAIFLLLVAWWLPKVPKEDRDFCFLFFATATVAILLTQKLVWVHYQLLCIPLMIYIFQKRESIVDRALLGFAVIGFAVDPTFWEARYWGVSLHIASCAVLLFVGMKHLKQRSYA